jgi:hypothetical protein
MITCSRDSARGSAFLSRPIPDTLHEPLCDSKQETERGAPKTVLSSHDSLINLDARLMAPYVIPEDVRRFLLRWIDSVVQLEALLLLRDNADSEWSLPAVAARLYLESEEVAPLLTRLCTDGFFVVTEGPAAHYRYRPSSPDLAAMVDRVAKEYVKHLVPITKLIHDKPRMRVQQFADAFKLRKKDDA